jgi:hypothetical protein
MPQPTTLPRAPFENMEKSKYLENIVMIKIAFAKKLRTDCIQEMTGIFGSEFSVYLREA